MYQERKLRPLGDLQIGARSQNVRQRPARRMSLSPLVSVPLAPPRSTLPLRPRRGEDLRCRSGFVLCRNVALCPVATLPKPPRPRGEENTLPHNIERKGTFFGVSLGVTRTYVSCARNRFSDGHAEPDCPLATMPGIRRRRGRIGRRLRQARRPPEGWGVGAGLQGHR